MSIPNFKESDFFCNSKIGKLGYNYGGGTNLDNSRYLLLFC